MLFRVLCCASVVGVIYATPNIEGLLPELLVHDITAVGVAAAAAGTGLKLAWRRCAQDGRDGVNFKGSRADSRVNRYARERGFRNVNQAEIDQDPVSRATQA
jgi:hypothetical protein